MCSVVHSRAVLTGFFLLSSIFHLQIRQGSTILFGLLSRQYTFSANFLSLILSGFSCFICIVTIAAIIHAFGISVNSSHHAV